MASAPWYVRPRLLPYSVQTGATGDDRDFYAGKLQACRFFFATEVPLIEHAARLVRDAEPSAFDMQAEWF